MRQDHDPTSRTADLAAANVAFANGLGLLLLEQRRWRRRHGSVRPDRLPSPLQRLQGRGARPVLRA